MKKILFYVGGLAFCAVLVVTAVYIGGGFDTQSPVSAQYQVPGQQMPVPIQQPSSPAGSVTPDESEAIRSLKLQ